MSDERGPWYLITGLVLGAVMGVLYAWVLQPVQYTDTTPASLRADFKDQYRAMIALAYMANGDLVRAGARLDLLEDEDVYKTLAEQAQRTLAGGSASQEARALGMLAVALGQSPSTLAAPGGGEPGSVPQETQVITPTLSFSAVLTRTLPAATEESTAQPTETSPTDSPTITPLPTRQPTPTIGSPFVLKSEELSCNPAQETPLIIVQAYDAAGQGIWGVEAVVNWEDGESHFFTGLKPELGIGYADFTMTPGVVYTLRLAEGGQTIPNLTPKECEAEGGERYWGSWLLVFAQP
ncbi:MAG TPA: hypothetical protein VIS10_01095 [Anaerolineales bacterium]